MGSIYNLSARLSLYLQYLFPQWNELKWTQTQRRFNEDE